MRGPTSGTRASRSSTIRGRELGQRRRCDVMCSQGMGSRPIAVRGVHAAHLSMYARLRFRFLLRVWWLECGRSCYLHWHDFDVRVGWSHATQLNPPYSLLRVSHPTNTRTGSGVRRSQGTSRERSINRSRKVLPVAHLIARHWQLLRPILLVGAR